MCLKHCQTLMMSWICLDAQHPRRAKYQWAHTYYPCSQGTWTLMYCHISLPLVILFDLLTDWFKALPNFDKESQLLARLLNTLDQDCLSTGQPLTGPQVFPTLPKKFNINKMPHKPLSGAFNCLIVNWCVYSPAWLRFGVSGLSCTPQWLRQRPSIHRPILNGPTNIVSQPTGPQHPHIPNALPKTPETIITSTAWVRRPSIKYSSSVAPTSHGLQWQHATSSTRFRQWQQCRVAPTTRRRWPPSPQMLAPWKGHPIKWPIWPCANCHICHSFNMASWVAARAYPSMLLPLIGKVTGSSPQIFWGESIDIGL